MQILDPWTIILRITNDEIRDKSEISGEIRCTTEECEIFANKGLTKEREHEF